MNSCAPMKHGIARVMATHIDKPNEQLTAKLIRAINVGHAKISPGAIHGRLG